MTSTPTYLQVSDVKGLLEDVGSIGTSRQAPHVSQVATVATHGLDDEHAALGPTGRLLDAVTGLATEKDTGHSNAWPASAGTKATKSPAGRECVALGVTPSRTHRGTEGWPWP